MLYLLPTWLVLFVSLRICLPHRIDHILLTLLASVVVSILWFFGLKSSLLPSLLQTRSPRAEANRDQRAAPVVAWGIAASVAVMLLLLVFGGVRHDYQSYMEQWAVINAGNRPWTDKSNTYLPLHSFLAPLASVHPLLVKLLFAVTALLTIAISSFGRIAGKEHFGRHEKSILFIATALCPFTLVMSFWLGLNDALTGSLLFIATILAAHHPGNFRNQFLAGALLAMGACIKIYPLLTAPFFLIRQKKIQWSFAAGCLTPSRVFREHGAWPYAIVILLAFRTFHRYLTPGPRRLDMPIAPGPST